MCSIIFLICNNTLIKRIENKEINNNKYFFTKDSNFLDSK